MSGTTEPNPHLSVAAGSGPGDPEVMVAVVGGRGSLVLNRPRALNALTLPMIRAIRTALDAFAADDAVRLVSITSTRPGVFCAGGDIRWVRQVQLEGRPEAAEAFFAEEYALNRAIAEYPKPYVALIDGVCMGGGLGISVHGTHRLVTESLQMAMPETAIGFFPDIGASYFLNRLPGELGLYLALTGARLSAADAIYCGLATAMVASDAFEPILAALSESADVDAAVAPHLTNAAQSSVLEQNRAVIDRCFGGDSVAEIAARLEADASPFAGASVALLRQLSPAGLAITLDLLRGNRDADLATCLARELALTRTVTRSADFIEGVRAVLVDKDRAPKWQETASGAQQS